jgi:hypothetical protein
MRGGSEKGKKRIRGGKKGKIKSKTDKARSEGTGGSKTREKSDDLTTTATKDKRKKRSRENVIKKIKIRRIRAVTITGERKISELSLI